MQGDLSIQEVAKLGRRAYDELEMLDQMARSERMEFNFIFTGGSVVGLATLKPAEGPRLDYSIELKFAVPFYTSVNLIVRSSSHVLTGQRVLIKLFNWFKPEAATSRAVYLAPDVDLNEYLELPKDPTDWTREVHPQGVSASPIYPVTQEHLYRRIVSEVFKLRDSVLEPELAAMHGR